MLGVTRIKLDETILFPGPAPPFHLRHPQDDEVPEPVEGLRPYFRFNRTLLKDYCHIARECLLEYLRTTLDLPDGLPGIVMAIHTFGDL